MNQKTTKPAARPTAREKLLDAAFSVIREQGYSATSVDDLCRTAGVTKGAFFHHFPSKEALAVAAANHWSEATGAFFAAAPYHDPKDPLDRVLGYVDFRRAILQGDVPEFTCLVGTMVQEAYGSSPDIRDACRASIFDHAANIERDIAEAMAERGINNAGWTARSLALHTQAVLQGAFILAKAEGTADGGANLAAQSVDHLRRYIEMLFTTEKLSHAA
ncbi:TetR/AcrR family transcriptional regulator [Parvularcula flava]|uniref:TetR family transcriptional regulator n=1 Tax=Aquisalinus luteolus TaxID=1566827 RepID=A0A8J3A401_9PROT|nr:TetR/AcrR family transcriptional regulator [Aquisalinus luteolus]NHK28395.1 TetR/AcrR family transcriptional regulator [Aquisalinus luteolus]GGH98346.1 TetR family transcriptional regulator [Aquisalinus luteolus]